MADAPSSSDRTVIHVDLTRSARRWPRRRPQRWSWTAVSAGNGRTLARSSEYYTNRADCIAAIYQLFGAVSDVYLRQEQIGDVTLRTASIR